MEPVLYDPTNLDIEHISVFHLKRMGLSISADVACAGDLLNILFTFPPWIAYIRALDPGAHPPSWPVEAVYYDAVEQSPRIATCIYAAAQVCAEGRWNSYILA